MGPSIGSGSWGPHESLDMLEGTAGHRRALRVLAEAAWAAEWRQALDPEL